MQAHAARARLPGGFHEFDLGLKRQSRRVHPAAVPPAALEQGRIDEGAGVEHEIRGLKQPRAPQGDEVRGAWAGADEGDGKAFAGRLRHGAGSFAGAVVPGGVSGAAASGFW